MAQAVSLFQKEMRDTIKMANDLQRKMKDFYKELKDEISQINTGPEQIEDPIVEKKKLTVIGDVSATGKYYAGDVSSDNWNSSFTFANSNSALILGDLTNLATNSGKWDSTWTVVYPSSAN